MIEFSCTYCGRKFKVADERCGKKGRCPNCKSTIIIPDVPIGDLVGPPTPAKPVQGEGKAAFNLTLLDNPRRDESRENQATEELPAGALSDEMLAILPGHVRRDELPATERKIPWPIDIFLYPLSKPGITILGMVVGIPLFLRISIAFLAILTAVFSPAIVILVLAWVVLILLSMVFYLYLAWYICECIRESALGGIRAPETASVTPGVGELVWQMLRVLIFAAFFVMPAVLYLGNVRQVDVIFWVLCGYAILFLPMSILALVMFDSFCALNPILLLGSIFSSLFSYIGLYIGFILVSIPAAMAVVFIPFNWFTFFISEAFIFYALLISAHLLGRFFWRCKENLNWEV